ncbi:pyrroloquinoline quinone biosynthesis protein PqqE [Roseococcus sp. SYP-B2431]|uniref:pyrroloquinoline quinone biosynthesis protein PqqE n=1 Tax=Roseococcus sp. SYP-B2431 TaxID=2496640 RepID=UPI00103E75CC|nr:pyrroloquinoline quinone biosynthesis protein PqqE [Roseococcus sp. SYP-B2431]TCH98027.1 pyrroloquinoline quinone biosynthesis protein PqqE [Roseococcus sp. SYP-B2431]
MSAIEPPLALLAELTHRCPLRCPYCSNPTELARAKDELTTAEWARVFREAAALGCLQLHLSGGEPTARRDIVEITAAAREAGLYSNLITAGVLLNAALMARLVEAGLDHVQLSVQDADEAGAERIGGMRGAQEKKRQAAALVRASGLPLTLNAVVHRQNLHNLPQLIDIALDWGAQRLEVAHVQYYGWALANRDALLPTRAQLDVATRLVEEARSAHRGRLVIDYVVPDYHAARPKACMGGWGRRFLAVSPMGEVLPCHAAKSIAGMRFPNIRDSSLEDAWTGSDAFNAFRGTAWMPPPCRGCAHAERDWGGCRCQAFALTGDAAATDPACALSPSHGLLAAAVAEAGEARFRYREFS